MVAVLSVVDVGGSVGAVAEAIGGSAYTVFHLDVATEALHGVAGIGCAVEFVAADAEGGRGEVIQISGGEPTIQSGLKKFIIKI